MNDLQIKEEVVNNLEIAKGTHINSDEDYAVADTRCAGLLALKKRIEDDFNPTKDAAYKAWKAVVAQEKGHLDGIDEARAIYKNRMGEWREKKEAARRAEEEALQAAAKKQAEDEALRAAEEAGKAGNNAEAEAILSAPVAVAPVVVAPSIPKSKTIIRKVWKFRIKDASKLPREYTTPDEKKIGGVVRSLGSAANIPGVEVYQDVA